jgi:hypothetical protein
MTASTGARLWFTRTGFWPSLAGACLDTGKFGGLSYSRITISRTSAARQEGRLVIEPSGFEKCPSQQKLDLRVRASQLVAGPARKLVVYRGI